MSDTIRLIKNYLSDRHQGGFVEAISILQSRLEKQNKFIEKAKEIVSDLAHTGVDYGYGEHVPDIQRARDFINSEEWREV